MLEAVVARVRYMDDYLLECIDVAIESEKINEFLTNRGFTDIKNLNAQDLRKRYFKGINAKRHISCVLNFVSASVKAAP